MAVTSTDSLRLSCSTYAYSQWQLPEALESIARVGYRGVELLTERLRTRDGGTHEHLRPDWPEERLSEVEAHLHRLGLQVTCVSPGTDFLKPRRGSVQGEVEEVCKNVDLAVRLGAPLVRPFATHDLPEGMGRQEAIDAMTQPLREAGDYAARRGMRIAIENHGIWPGVAQNLADLLAAIGSDAVGLTVHYPRPTAEELLRLVPHKIWHLHLSDRKSDGLNRADVERLRREGLTTEQIAARLGVAVEALRPRPLALGEGDADLLGVVRTLRRHGYGGWYNHEGGPEENPEPTELRSIAYLRQQLS